MPKLSPKQMMIAGVVLMVLGVIIPLLMVLDVLKANFTLSFISYTASIIGSFLAYYGLFTHVRINRNQK